MSNPINIPKCGKKHENKSHSCPTNFVFYNKKDKNSYNNLFYSMRNLGMNNSYKKNGYGLSMSPIMCGGLVHSNLSLSSSNNSGFSSLNHYENKIMDNSLNSNNSSILLSYMNQYMSDDESDPDPEDSNHYNHYNHYNHDDHHDHDISNDAFTMDEDKIDEDNPFTFETFSNVAISIMNQNEK